MATFKGKQNVASKSGRGKNRTNNTAGNINFLH
jgi:hypothetical protein